MKDLMEKLTKPMKTDDPFEDWPEKQWITEEVSYWKMRHEDEIRENFKKAKQLDAIIELIQKDMEELIS